MRHGAPDRRSMNLIVEGLGRSLISSLANRSTKRTGMRMARKAKGIENTRLLADKGYVAKTLTTLQVLYKP